MKLTIFLFSFVYCRTIDIDVRSEYGEELSRSKRNPVATFIGYEILSSKIDYFK